MAGPASKSNRVSNDFAKSTNPDQEKGEAILREFRGLGISGDYFLEFELRVLPRRGKETVFTGQLWGSRNEMGQISRVMLQDGKGGGQQMLIQNGSVPAVWVLKTGQSLPQMASRESLFKPLLPETEFTLFDLQMPYFYWDNFTFEGVSKILGRAAHTFLLHPPEGDGYIYQSIGAVRVQLDTQYHAMVQSALIDREGTTYKTLSLRDLKKVDYKWMIKSIDLRNEITRDKTRFQVLRAAVNLDLSSRIFEPESLTEIIGQPSNTISLCR